MQLCACVSVCEQAKLKAWMGSDKCETWWKGNGDKGKAHRLLGWKGEWKWNCCEAIWNQTREKDQRIMDVRGLHSYVTGFTSPEKNKLWFKSYIRFYRGFSQSISLFFPNSIQCCTFYDRLFKAVNLKAWVGAQRWLKCLIKEKS